MKKGLILIDVQNDYFPGGSMELVGMEQAAENTGLLLTEWRKRAFPVFHIHISQNARERHSSSLTQRALKFTNPWHLRRAKP
ncbi:MAG: cysteine hydrolase family protein [Syntrophales bacterium]